MADDKDKKPSGGAEGTPFGSNVWEFLIFGGLLITVLTYAISNLLNFIKNKNPLDDSAFLDTLRTWFFNNLPFFKIASFFISAFLVYLTVSTVRKLNKVNAETKKKFANPNKGVEKSSEVGVNGEAVLVSSGQNKRWQRVIEHAGSENPNDWKIAIIEADSILDEMIKGMGYHGDSMGERMKAIEVSDFNTLNNAWEAHKVRNTIAHEGSNFQLNEREARRVIALYKSVFEEFKYI